MRHTILLFLGFAPCFALHAQLSLGSNGIRFPDGSVQTKAATSSSEALPQNCHSPIMSPGDIEYPICETVGFDSLGWNNPEGVPAGFVFLVTDVHVNTTVNPPNGRTILTLARDLACATAGPGSILTDVVSYPLDANQSTLIRSYNAPVMIIAEGECLRFTALGGNTVTLEAHVSGYLMPSF